MDHLALLKQYIREKEDSDIVSHGFPFVTISRQSGAGGHMLAKAILSENGKAVRNPTSCFTIGRFSTAKSVRSLRRIPNSATRLMP